MIPTTQGLGPFYAKIVFNDAVYVCDAPYKTEEEALIEAAIVCKIASSQAEETIGSYSFHKQG